MMREKNLRKSGILTAAIVLIVSFCVALFGGQIPMRHVEAETEQTTIELNFDGNVTLENWFYSYQTKKETSGWVATENASVWTVEGGYLKSNVSGATSAATNRDAGAMLTFRDYLFKNVRVTYVYRREFAGQKPVRPAIGVRGEAFDKYYEAVQGGVGLSNTNDGCALIYNGRGINKQDTVTKITGFNDAANDITVIVSIIGNTCHSEIVNPDGTNAVSEYTIQSTDNVLDDYGALTVSTTGTNRWFKSILVENLDDNGNPAPLVKVATALGDLADVQLEVNDTYRVEPVMGNTDECSSLKLSSNDENVVTVLSDGSLKAISAGTAVITAEVPFTNLTDTFTVTVVGEGQATIEPNEIQISHSSVVIAAGDDKTTVSATVLPENATNKSVEYESSDETVFTVSPDGKVTGIGEGRAQLTVKVTDTQLEKTIPVYVFAVAQASESTLVYDFSDAAQMEDFIPYNYVEVSGTSFGYEQTLFEADWLVDEETGELRRQSQDPVKGVGEAAILTVKDKFFENFEIVFSGKKLQSKPGRAQVAFRQTAEGTYNTRDGAGAWIQGNGMITLWGEPGVDGPYQDTEKNGWTDREYHVMKIRVVGQTIRIWVDGVERELKNKSGETFSFGSGFVRGGYVSLIGVGCETAYDYFSITNLDAEGNPAPISSGAATGISLNRSSYEGKVGDTLRLSYTIEPAHAVNKAVTWSSSDATVAKVDETGKVTLLKEGTANIIVTSADGGFTATCAITVTAKQTDDKPEKGGCGSVSGNGFSGGLGLLLLCLGTGVLFFVKGTRHA